jgi:uncharacterized DUF497 family protein
MHPSQATEFEWDDANERELWRHRIAPGEVEEVFDNHPAWIPNKRNRAGDWKMVGRTNGGRSVTVVVRHDEDSLLLRAITGWDS